MRQIEAARLEGARTGPPIGQAAVVHQAPPPTVRFGRRDEDASTGRRDAVRVAEELAHDFRARAASAARAGSVPAENHRRMHEAGYLAAAVPTELGGLGAGLLDMARAQQALARACATTALAINAHHFQLGATADAWRNGAPVEPLLRRVADEGIVLTPAAAEAVTTGGWTVPVAAERVDGGYRVIALDAEAGEAIVGVVPSRAEGLRVVEAWDGAGGSAAAGPDIVFEHVFVPDAAVAARFRPRVPLVQTGLAGWVVWSDCLEAGVYLGIAEAARAEAYRWLGAVGGTLRDPAPADMMLGELETEYLTCLAVRDAIVGGLDADRRTRWPRYAGRCSARKS